MDPAHASEIIACLPKGRTLFPYFPGRYALMLLAWRAGEGVSVRELKGGRHAGLLRQPVVRELLRELPDGVVTADAAASVWEPATESYRLTLGRWGDREGWVDRWQQTSRPGENLVLQVNFSERHNRRYRRWLDPDGCLPFRFSGHPVAEPPELTLAWARLDVDLDAGEALIEEIQSDWVREAFWTASWAEAAPSEAERRARVARTFGNEAATPVRLRRYLREALEPHARSWPEVTLAASLWFLRVELGIARIYFHTHEGGVVLKGLDGCWGRPPRSLYTTLPRRFCFEETDAPPRFLSGSSQRRVRQALRRHRPRWFVTEL